MGSLGNNCFFLSDSVIYSASATAPAFDGQPLGMTYTKKKNQYHTVHTAKCYENAYRNMLTPLHTYLGWDKKRNIKIIYHTEISISL